MNFSHDDLAIMDSLIGVIVNSDAWDREQLQNPEILAASDKMDAALDRIRGIIPDEAIGQIEDAALDYSTAFYTAAILYGMHVANIISNISAHPSDLSQFILDRIDRQTGGHAHG